MKTDDTLASTCDNVYDIAGGRKTTDNEATIENIVARKIGNDGGEGEEEVAVLVSVGQDDVVAFSYEVESVPSLESESDDDEEEEEEENWESDEEGESALSVIIIFCVNFHL